MPSCYICGHFDVDGDACKKKQLKVARCVRVRGCSDYLAYINTSDYHDWLKGIHSMGYKKVGSKSE